MARKPKRRKKKVHVEVDLRRNRKQGMGRRAKKVIAGAVKSGRQTGKSNTLLNFVGFHRVGPGIANPNALQHVALQGQSYFHTGREPEMLKNVSDNLARKLRLEGPKNAPAQFRLVDFYSKESSLVVAELGWPVPRNPGGLFIAWGPFLKNAKHTRPTMFIASCKSDE